MPNFSKIDSKELESLKKDGGKNINTIRKRELHVGHFIGYLRSKGFDEPINFENLAKDNVLDNLLCEFFTCLRVTKSGHDDLPKASY